MALLCPTLWLPAGSLPTLRLCSCTGAFLKAGLSDTLCPSVYIWEPNKGTAKGQALTSCQGLLGLPVSPCPHVVKE